MFTIFAEDKNVGDSDWNTARIAAKRIKNKRIDR
jgi:hypothetical protein